MEKKEFEKAEVEEIRFDTNDDIVTKSTMTIVVGGEPAQGDPFADDGF